MKNTLIAPSVLAADFANLQRDIEMINNSEADWFHIDVMDGHFVPNISYGMPVIEAIKKHATKPLDVHLMIEKPEEFIGRWLVRPIKRAIVHLEAVSDMEFIIEKCHRAGIEIGLAINPETSWEMLASWLNMRTLAASPREESRIRYSKVPGTAIPFRLSAPLWHLTDHCKK